MKNFWKWILGIVIVLVVLFGLGIGARFLMANYLPTRVLSHDGYTVPFMMEHGMDDYGSRVFSYRTMPFGGMMLLGWLIPLGLVGLLAYGAYWLGKKRASDKLAAMPPAAPIQVHNCPKCGQQVEEGWSHCAHCGKKL